MPHCKGQIDSFGPVCFESWYGCKTFSKWDISDVSKFFEMPPIKIKYPMSWYRSATYCLERYRFLQTDVLRFHISTIPSSSINMKSIPSIWGLDTDVCIHRSALSEQILLLLFDSFCQRRNVADNISMDIFPPRSVLLDFPAQLLHVSIWQDVEVYRWSHLS